MSKQVVKPVSQGRLRQQAVQDAYLRERQVRDAAARVGVWAVYGLPLAAGCVALAYGVHLILAQQWDDFRTLGGGLIAAVLGYVVADLRDKGVRKD